MTRLKIFLPFFVFLTCFMFSCKEQALQTLEYSISDIDLIMEGPLFEGPNDLQAKVFFDPEETLKTNGFSKDQIKDIRIKSISLKSAESDFNIFESIVLQITGVDAPLTTVGVINPVPKNKHELNSDIQIKNSFTALKNTGFFYLVIDANVIESYDGDITFKGDIVINMDIKNQ